MNKKSQDLSQWETYSHLYHKGKGLAGDDLHNDLIQPILDDFLGDYTGQTILDAGCGNGFLSQQLAKSAKKVIGIDVSEKLLGYAKQHKRGENVSFKKADLTQKLPFGSGEFDIVVGVMVLQYIPKIQTFASECSRILKANGKSIVIIDHPSHALFLRAQELVGKKNEKFITSGSYFDSGQRKKHSLWNNAILQYYHRPVSFYVNSFANRFRLAKLNETTNDGEVPRILGFDWLNSK